ncbi:MAG: hypothetical protein ACK506_25805, partial [Pirellula sp.]
FRSCLHLVLLSYELFIWYDDSLPKVLELNTRDFHPIRSRPCWAYMDASRRSAAISNHSYLRRLRDRQR